MKKDIKEYLFWYRKKFKRVDEILLNEFGSKILGRGYCQIYWNRKKELLKELYGINWKTPSELNPNIKFD